MAWSTFVLISFLLWLSVAATNTTINDTFLQTWWHNTGEINTQTPVQAGNVRQSHLYSVQVGSSANGPFYDSFAYETIPRNGQGNILIPGDPYSTTDNDDGITIEPDVNITMAWSSFLYSSDAWVKVSRTDGSPANSSSVVIRPTNLDYDVADSNGDIVVHVPYTSFGSRFSIEFQEDLYTYVDSCSTDSSTECGYVQNENPHGFSYVFNYTESMPIMGVEPRNALLIFAGPFPESQYVPVVSAESSCVVDPGFVGTLSETTASTVVFNPGVYYFGATNHAILSPSVNWVYFAPGAFVKGAIQFTSNASLILATGSGVLSGEQYVYQADPSQGYTNSENNDDCLRMWSGHSTSDVNQTFLVAGPTVNSPPFNSMDFTGDVSTMTVQAWEYKQVGAYFGQTDGMENYPGSHVHDVFYHSNDDTLKTYYSDVLIERVVVWKATTAPTIQFGWCSRNLTNVTVDNVDIIHSRYSSNGSHPSLIGANQVYGTSETDISTADLSNTISNITLSNLRSEGISGDLFRIVPLSNIQNLRIENVSIDAFSAVTNGIHESQIPVFTDAAGVPVQISNFVVSGYYVNGTAVTENNMGAGSLGSLNIPEDFAREGGVTIV
ncbi:MAG: hypothetical protein LQ340_007278 [Diploschistes diacapsis]|nr:MAG: hypothetical protein LQ340_007278 [Diploschistes diacapsis]